MGIKMGQQTLRQTQQTVFVALITFGWGRIGSFDIPSGVLKHVNWKSPIEMEVLVGKSSVNGWFSIATFDYRTVNDKTKSITGASTPTNINILSKWILKNWDVTKKAGCVVQFFNLVGGLQHFLFSHILGMSSSQLTNSMMFQRGRRKTTNPFIVEHTWE